MEKRRRSIGATSGQDRAMTEIDYRVLGPEQAGEVLTLQRAAFLAEARLYGTTEIPPLIESLDDVRRELASALVIRRVPLRSGHRSGSPHPRRSGRLDQSTGRRARPAGKRDRSGAPRGDRGSRSSPGSALPARGGQQEQGECCHVRAPWLRDVLASSRLSGRGTRAHGQGPRVIARRAL